VFTFFSTIIVQSLNTLLGMGKLATHEITMSHTRISVLKWCLHSLWYLGFQGGEN